MKFTTKVIIYPITSKILTKTKMAIKSIIKSKTQSVKILHHKSTNPISENLTRHSYLFKVKLCQGINNEN